MIRVPCRLSNFGFVMMRPAPAVQVYCYINRLNRGEWVDFLIDTGASESCLNSIYALDLQQSMRPQTLETSIGIGGNCLYFHEQATLVFRDERNQPMARLVRRLGIQQIRREYLSIPNFLDCPSLLGRDILNQCQLYYRFQQGVVELIFP